MSAARQLAKNDHWIGALSVYANLSKTAIDQKRPIPDPDGLHEAVYRAYGLKDATTYVPFRQIQTLEPNLVKIARGRYSLMVENTPALAQKLVDELLADNPYMPDARLLQAEINIRLGKTQQARDALKPFGQGDAPEWVKKLVNEILKSIP